MGQKVCPTGFRLGITENWRSRWYADKKKFGKLLVEDQKIRKYIKKNYRFTGIPKVEIERTRDEGVRIIVFSARPGLIIGRKGSEIEKLKESIEKLVEKTVEIPFPKSILDYLLDDFSERRAHYQYSDKHPDNRRYCEATQQAESYNHQRYHRGDYGSAGAEYHEKGVHKGKMKGEYVKQGQVVGTCGGSGHNPPWPAHIRYSSIGYYTDSNVTDPYSSVECYVNYIHGTQSFFGKPPDCNCEDGATKEAYNHTSSNTSLFDNKFFALGGSAIFGSMLADPRDTNNVTGIYWYNTYVSNDPKNCYVRKYSLNGYNSMMVYDALHGARSPYMIQGGFYDWWTAHNGPKSELRMPISDKQDIMFGFYAQQNFQYGYLYSYLGIVISYKWKNNQGPGVLQNNSWSNEFSYLFAEAFTRSGGVNLVGYPDSGVYLENGIYKQNFVNSWTNNLPTIIFYRPDNFNQKTLYASLPDNIENDERLGGNKAFAIKLFWQNGLYKIVGGFSVLGAPISDEILVDGLITQFFEKGFLVGTETESVTGESENNQCFLYDSSSTYCEKMQSGSFASLTDFVNQHIYEDDVSFQGVVAINGDLPAVSTSYYTFNSIQIAEDVNTSYPYAPIGVKYTFYPDDEQVTCLIKLTNLHKTSGPIYTRFKFYDPSGKMVSTWDYTVPAGTYDWYKIWDFMPKEQWTKTGYYNVIFEVDEGFGFKQIKKQEFYLFAKNFELQTPAIQNEVSFKDPFGNLLFDPQQESILVTVSLQNVCSQVQAKITWYGPGNKVLTEEVLSESLETGYYFPNYYLWSYWPMTSLIPNGNWTVKVQLIAGNQTQNLQTSFTKKPQSVLYIPHLDKVGVVHFKTNGNVFSLDYNFDGNEDFSELFGYKDVPLIGDLNGDNFDEIVAFSDGKFWIDDNYDGVTDKVLVFGKTGDIPIIGDWLGDGKDHVGVYRPSEGKFYLNYNNDSIAEEVITYGNSTDIPLAGRFQDGQVGIGVFRSSEAKYYLDYNRDGVTDEVRAFGHPGDLPVIGDFNADGSSDFGNFRCDNPNDCIFYLDFGRDGVLDKTVHMGVKGDLPVAGNWFSQPQKTVTYVPHQDQVGSVHVQSNGNVFSFDYNFDSNIDRSVLYGKNGDIVLTGDFNGDGFDEIAVFNGGVFYIDFNCDGVVDKTVYFGKNGDIPIIGDWINDGKDHVGIYRPIEGRFYFDYNDDGKADEVRPFGHYGDIPLIGRFQNGQVGVGVFRPSEAKFYLDYNRDGVTDEVKAFGHPGDLPVIGDFNADGSSDFGIYRCDNPNDCIFYLDFGRDGSTNKTVHIGVKGDVPISGNWVK